MKKVIKWTAVSVFVMLILLVGGFVGWANNTPEPMAEAVAALESDTAVTVTVTEEGWFTFAPTGKETSTGLIFYPGGRVDARSYAPTARTLAEQGYFVTIVPMPLNLAFFDADAATDVMAAYPQIEQWVLAGHSLGGAMAAQFTHDHLADVAGLVLLAAYPTAGSSLADAALPVLSVFASEDGLATAVDMAESQAYLPPQTEWVVIDGGNHAQFGWYGEQSGDLPAQISRETQQAEVIEATLNLLANLAPQS